jgi:hypothetical protein
MKAAEIKVPVWDLSILNFFQSPVESIYCRKGLTRRVWPTRPVPRFVNSCTWWLILDLDAVGDTCEILVYEALQKYSGVHNPPTSRGTRLSVFCQILLRLNVVVAPVYETYRSVTMATWEDCMGTVGGDIGRCLGSEVFWDKGRARQGKRLQMAWTITKTTTIPIPPPS